MGRKKYYTYEELTEMLTEKTTPNLGRGNLLNFTIKKGGDEELIIFKEGGTVTIKPGDVIGVSSEKIWRVPKPKDYPDKIRGLLAERHIAQSALSYTDEDIFVKDGETYLLFPSPFCVDSEPVDEDDVPRVTNSLSLNDFVLVDSPPNDLIENGSLQEDTIDNSTLIVGYSGVIVEAPFKKDKYKTPFVRRIAIRSDANRDSVYDWLYIRLPIPIFEA